MIIIINIAALVAFLFFFSGIFYFDIQVGKAWNDFFDKMRKSEK